MLQDSCPPEVDSTCSPRIIYCVWTAVHLLLSPFVVYNIPCARHRIVCLVRVITTHLLLLQARCPLRQPKQLSSLSHAKSKRESPLCGHHAPLLLHELCCANIAALSSHLQAHCAAVN
jgi:hypothetical protein